MIALGHLAVLLRERDGRVSFQRARNRAVQRGAEQGHPLAMYILGLRFRYGKGVGRDLGRAFELFRSAAEGGIVSAKVEAGDALDQAPGGLGFHRGAVSAVDRGGRSRFDVRTDSARETYPRGAMARRTNEKPGDRFAPMPVSRCSGLAAWPRRGDALRRRRSSRISMQSGVGLSAPQPEAAERYWRLAAQTGNAVAQVTFADRLRRRLRAGEAGVWRRNEGIRLLEPGDGPGLGAGRAGARPDLPGPENLGRETRRNQPR